MNSSSFYFLFHLRIHFFIIERAIEPRATIVVISVLVIYTVVVNDYYMSISEY